MKWVQRSRKVNDLLLFCLVGLIPRSLAEDVSQTVRIRVLSLDVEELDAFKMEMKVRLEVEQSMKNEEAVNSNQTGSSRGLGEFIVENGREVESTRREVKAAGHVVVLDKIAVRVGCVMDFSTYPFDHQRCSAEMRSENASVQYQFGNFQNVGKAGNLKSAHTPILRTRIYASPFSIVSASASIQGEVFYGDTISKLVVHVRTRRNYSAYLGSYFLPMASFVFISLLTLWLVYPKISVMVNFLNIILVNVFLILQRSQLDIPKVYYATSMSVYSVTSLIFVVLVLLVNVYVLYYIKSEEEDDAEKAQRRRAYDLNIRQDIKFIPPSSRANHINSSSFEEEPHPDHRIPEASTWVLVKRKIMDRIRRNSHWALLITFLLFNLVFWLSMLCLHYLQ